METKQLLKGWKEVELGEILDYEQPTNYIVDSDKYNDEYQTPVLTAGKSFILGHTNEKEGIYNKLPVIIFDDFTTANKFVTFPFKVKSSAMKLLTPKTEDVDLKFIFLLMQTIKINSETHKRYYLSKYSKLKIWLPPIPIQEKIVSIIEKIENIKEWRKESNDLTEDFLNSIFSRMFLKKGPERISSEGWESGKLSSFVDEFIVPQRDKPKNFDGNTPWCRIEDFNGIYLSESKSKKSVSEETIKKMNLKVYPINSVIVSCSADLGKCAIIKKPLVTNQTFIGLVPSKKMNSLFLYYHMISKAKKLNNMATGATIKYLSKKKFQELKVDIPPLPLQEKFASIVKQVEKLKEYQKQSEEEINNLFNALMQKAFRGDL